jgi:hypothetical protein
MKKYLVPIFMAFAIAGCEDFLDTKDLMNKNEDNFPETEKDCEAALAAVYNSMALNQEASTYFIGEFISDDRFAGGGANDFHVHAWEELTAWNENQHLDAWSNLYQGIFRANKLIEGIDNVLEFSSEENRNTVMAEALFMRAYFYFELAQLFGEVPLLPNSNLVNIPKSPAAEVFSLIASDLNDAIALFPSVNYHSIPTDRLGHANKWAAEGLLARVYLFYSGYYKSETLPLYDGGSLSKAQVIGFLEDCINNSGHALAADFRELWPYTNEFTVEEYSFTRGRGLQWLNETGDNMETVFSIKIGAIGDWGTPYNNWVAVGFSLRGQSDYSNCFPFGGGWGFGPVNPRLVEQWIVDEPSDSIRRSGSVLDLDDPAEGLVSYDEGGWEQVDDTHLFSKKYTVITAWRNKDLREVYSSYGIPMHGATDEDYLSATQDIVLLRFADILLMHSELSQTNTGLNLVRQRVGLQPVPYSLDAIKKERRYELAFEGLRYYDLLRWYGKEAGAVIDANQNGVVTLNNLVETTVQFNLTGRVQETGGFLQIPESQIDLSAGVLEQNQGWE